MTKLKGTRHTRYFSNVDEVEYVFGLTFSHEQKLMLQTYITTGQRPDNGGCWTCSPAYIRTLTATIDTYEDQLDKGEALWPWPETLPTL